MGNLDIIVSEAGDEVVEYVDKDTFSNVDNDEYETGWIQDDEILSRNESPIAQYPNPILLLLHLPPYSKMDFDLRKVDPYARPHVDMFWNTSKEFTIRMIFPFRDVVMAAIKEYHLHRHY